jgi:exoribonuclease R
VPFNHACIIEVRLLICNIGQRKYLIAIRPNYEKEYVIKGSRHGRKFRLGDNVHVKVVRINAFRSEIDFQLV